MKLVSELRSKVIDGLTSELQMASFLAKCAQVE